MDKSTETNNTNQEQETGATAQTLVASMERKDAEQKLKPAIADVTDQDPKSYVLDCIDLT